MYKFLNTLVINSARMIMKMAVNIIISIIQLHEWQRRKQFALPMQTSVLRERESKYFSGPFALKVPNTMAHKYQKRFQTKVRATSFWKSADKFIVATFWVHTVQCVYIERKLTF
jgi:hypothetical protein